MAVNTKDLRVLVLADGRSFHTERFVAELKNQHCEVCLASLEPGEIECRPLRYRGPLSTTAYALAKGEVERLVGSFRPDVISAHYASGYGFLMSRVRRGAIPLTLHVWGSDVLVVPQKSWLHRRKVVAGLRAADQLFADSRYLADAVIGLAGERPIHVHPWGVERRYLCLHRPSYALNRPLRIIVPRLHEPIYDNLFIVQSLQDEIRQKKITVTFPAFGSMYARFRQHTDSLAGGLIQYYRKLPREEFLPFMASHDVCLSAARSDSSPVTLIEAMALGLIPVAADIPGVREWLTPESGFAYPLDDDRALRQIVAKLFGSDSSYEAMRGRNRERVEQEAVFEDNVAAQVATMRMLCERRSYA